MFKLDGKKALVTGATGGIGSEIAKILHAQGAEIVISGTREENLNNLIKEISKRKFEFNKFEIMSN